MTDADKLWAFSLGLYEAPEVKEACLALQNNYNADVNLLLFLLYQGSLKQQLSQEEIKKIDNEIASFREQIIQPIRRLRQSLKHNDYRDGESLYKDTLDLELAAEKLEQKQLALLKINAINSSTRSKASKHNLYAYANLLTTTVPNSDIETLLRHSST